MMAELLAAPFGALVVSLLAWKCVPLARLYGRAIFAVVSYRLDPAARDTWAHEVLDHMEECLWHDLRRGDSRYVVAWKASLRATSLLWNAPAERSFYTGTTSMPFYRGHDPGRPDLALTALAMLFLGMACLRLVLLSPTMPGMQVAALLTICAASGVLLLAAIAFAKAMSADPAFGPLLPVGFLMLLGVLLSILLRLHPSLDHLAIVIGGAVGVSVLGLWRNNRRAVAVAVTAVVVGVTAPASVALLLDFSAEGNGLGSTGNAVTALGSDILLAELGLLGWFPLFVLQATLVCRGVGILIRLEDANARRYAQVATAWFLGGLLHAGLGTHISSNADAGMGLMFFATDPLMLAANGAFALLLLQLAAYQRKPTESRATLPSRQAVS